MEDSFRNKFWAAALSFTLIVPQPLLAFESSGEESNAPFAEDSTSESSRWDAAAREPATSKWDAAVSETSPSEEPSAEPTGPSPFDTANYEEANAEAAESSIESYTAPSPGPSESVVEEHDMTSEMHVAVPPSMDIQAAKKDRLGSGRSKHRQASVRTKAKKAKQQISSRRSSPSHNKNAKLSKRSSGKISHNQKKKSGKKTSLAKYDKKQKRKPSSAGLPPKKKHKVFDQMMAQDGY